MKPTHHQNTWQILALCLVMIAALSITGCQRYGNVSDKTYQHASALFSICNLQDDERLHSFRNSMEQNDDLPASEKNWLLEIVSMAENDDWETATSRARQLMDEQVTD